MRNSIDYPGERAPRRHAVIAQAGYTGQNHFSVTYGDQKVTVRAEDGYAALFLPPQSTGAINSPARSSIRTPAQPSSTTRRTPGRGRWYEVCV